MNSAQRSHEEIRGTNWFPFFFWNMLWQKFLVQIATKKHGTQHFFLGFGPLRPYTLHPTPATVTVSVASRLSQDSVAFEKQAGFLCCFGVVAYF